MYIYKYRYSSSTILGLNDTSEFPIIFLCSLVYDGMIRARNSSSISADVETYVKL